MASKIMYESLKAQLDGHLKAAREVTDRAAALGREMTGDEGELAADHITKARELAGKVKALGEQLAHEDAVHQQVKGISDRIGGMPGGSYTPAGYGSTAAAVSPVKHWTDAVVRKQGDGIHFKGLLDPAGSVVVAIPAPDVVPMGRAALRLRQVCPVEVTAGVYAYLQQTVRTNNAAPVAPGDLKPTSTFTMTRVQDTVKTIAHLSEPVARQDISDAPALQAFLQSEMFYGIERALEAQIVSGDGTGANLLGLAHVSGVQTQAAPGTGEDLLTTTRRALTKLEVQGLIGSAFVMHPSDWEQLELLRTSTGMFYVNGEMSGGTAPVDVGARRLWSTPVVATPSCPQGTAYVFEDQSVRLFVREEVGISWSENTWRPDAFTVDGAPVGSGDFARNLIAWRAESLVNNRFRVRGRVGEWFVLRRGGVPGAAP